MRLFADYIAPLTHWLQLHPSLALLITFLISFSESLAIVGSIIPGSLTMTAIGILAGSGIMRIDFTLIAAVLGAMAGDSASYLLGFLYRDTLVGIWPFSRNPSWLCYGKEYFARHGGKSVLIGRFFGPLRSIIPLIAGMMHMSHWQFFLANFFSAIGWSILYVMPGVLIGAASNELSAENATRLCLLILAAIALIWFLSVFLRWLLRHTNRLLDYGLNRLWSFANSRCSSRILIKAITPAGETNHYATAALFLMLVLSCLGLIILTVMTYRHTHLRTIDYPIYYFLQSIRTIPIDAFLIFMAQISAPFTLFIFLLMTGLGLLRIKYYRAAKFWLSLFLITLAMAALLGHFVPSTRPQGILFVLAENPFADKFLSLTMAMYGFLLFFTQGLQPGMAKRYLRITLGLALLINGFANLYLGDFWFTDLLTAYLLGWICCLIHWLLYRKALKDRTIRITFLAVIMSVIAMTMSVVTLYNFPQLYYRHIPFHTQHVINEDYWWEGGYSVLPLYRNNRLGRPINLFNLQYAGNLTHIKQSLLASGWEVLDDSFLQLIVQRFNHPPFTRPLPLLRQLYNNQIPSLSMLFTDPKTHQTLVLHFWPSSYHLEGLNQIIWVGSIHSQTLDNRQALAVLEGIKPALHHYKWKEVFLNKPLKAITFPVENRVLLVREELQIS